MVGRYYVQSIGRFASADTIVPDPTTPQSFNRYSYVLNQPTKYIDPSGHNWECPDPVGCGSGTPASPIQPSPTPQPQPVPTPPTPYPGPPEVPPDEVDTLARTSEPAFRPPLRPLPGRTPGRGFDADGHSGVDYGATGGTLLYSPGTGLVVVVDSCSLADCQGLYGNTSADVNGGYGNLIIIEIPFDFLPQEIIEAYGLKPNQSLYVLFAHMEEPSNLEIGDVVDFATVVGLVGDSGYSDGTHLHVEIRVGTTGSLWSPNLCTTVCRDSDPDNLTPWEIWWDVLTPVDPEEVFN